MPTGTGGTKSVSSAPEKPADASTETPSPTFETAMERLDALVREMEPEKLPLETLLSRYEEGVRLVKSCNAHLDVAEQRVRVLSQGAGGEVQWTDVPQGVVKEEGV